MRVNYVIDWLAYNAVGTYDLHPQLMACKMGEFRWEKTNATFGYTRAISTSDGAKIMWNPERREMGVFCSYGGRALNAYRERNIQTEEIIDWHSRNGDTCRRIDVALDVHDARLNIARLASLFRRGKAKTLAKKHMHVVGGAGQTLYVGSRESEQFVRIYDKAKEQGDMVSDWIRIELELKGSRAVEFAAIVANHDEQYAATRMKSLMKSIVDFPNEVWRAVMGDMAVGIAKARDNEPDTAAWLMTSVAPTLGRFISKSGDKTFLERFLIIVAAFSDQSDKP